MDFITPSCRTARTSKVHQVQKGYASYGEKWEVVALDDLIAGDLSDALKGEELL